MLAAPLFVVVSVVGYFARTIQRAVIAAVVIAVFALAAEQVILLKSLTAREKAEAEVKELMNQIMGQTRLEIVFDRLLPKALIVIGAGMFGIAGFAVKMRDAVSEKLSDKEEAE